MPVLRNTTTGRDEFVPNEALDRALASGDFVAPEGLTQAVVTPAGRTVEAPVEAVAPAQAAVGVAPATEAARGKAEGGAFLEAEHGGIGSELLTFGEGALDAASGGLFGVAARNLAPNYNDERRARAEVNPIANTTGKVAGVVGSAVTGVGAGGLAAKAGGAVTKKLGGGILATGTGMAAEGALLGATETAQEMALAEDPVTVDRVVGSLKSNMLFGGASGFGIGIVGKVAAKGLAKGKALVDEHVAKQASAASIPDDLRNLDAAGLRAAKESAEAAVNVERAAAKVSVADEVVELRRASKEAKTWLATEDKSLRKVALKADRTLDTLTDNLKGLGQNPKKALDALQRNEQVLQKILDTGAGIADDSTRRPAYEAVTGLLERNRALQGKIENLYTPLASPRLTAIQAAQDALANGGGGKSFLGGLVDKGLQGAGMSAAAGLLPGGPVGALGMMIAPQVVGKLKDLVTGRLLKAGAESSLRSSAAIDAFVSTAGKAAKATPPLATRVLAGVSFGPTKAAAQPATKRTAPLMAAYKARESELMGQITVAPDGRLVMKPSARAEMAERLAGVRALAPVLADRMETVAARRVEFLASKLPKRPDMVAMQLGPDRWQPSDMDVRTFARFVAAVEDPGGVEERLVSGTVTPEDAEAYRSVYPERFEDFKRQIVERLPELRASLPYSRKVALSIFTGVPVDPAMHPQVLRVLQSMYADEPNTEGGTMAPVAQPQMGSISKPDPTAAQKRAG